MQALGKVRGYPWIHRFPFQDTLTCTLAFSPGEKWLWGHTAASESFSERQNFSKCAPKSSFFSLFSCYIFVWDRWICCLKCRVMEKSRCALQTSGIYSASQHLCSALCSLLNVQHIFRVSQPLFRIFFFPDRSLISVAETQNLDPKFGKGNQGHQEDENPFSPCTEHRSKPFPLP